MRPGVTLPLLLGVSACATAAGLHRHDQLPAGKAHMCMAPGGQWAAETVEPEPGISGGVPSCPAPARYIAINVCDSGTPTPPETPETWRDRRADARDGSLEGDGYGGIEYCVWRLGGPPLPPPLPPPAPPEVPQG